MNLPACGGDPSQSDMRSKVVLVSGLSGAGKASILRALEDLGFEAVDNPPLAMLEELVRAANDGGHRLAIGVDARTRGFDRGAIAAVLRRLRADPRQRPELIFASADEAVLLRRFTETRRRHPLAETGRVADGIEAEQRVTAELRDAADLVIDTSDLPLAELRQLIDRRYAPGPASDGPEGQLAVTIMSFAFPAGLPRESDMVLDVRFLLNPHYVAALQSQTGLDEAVGRYIREDGDFLGFLERVRDLLRVLLPRYVQEGKKYFTLAIGCTGGRHRSVYMVECLGRDLRESGWRVTVVHRELAKNDDTGWSVRRPAHADPTS